MIITDSHNHIHFQSFNNDLEDVMARARCSGVQKMLLVGIDPYDSKRALDVSLTREGLFVSIGIHPQEANEFCPEDVLNLHSLALNPKVVAIGETGFDLFRSPESEDLQKGLFISHIELAGELDLPLVIHDRDAHSKTLSVLDSMNAWNLGGVFHCFSGDTQMASYILDHGFFISVPGIVTYTKATILKEVVRMCPLESLLVETDAPFLSPVPNRGKRNEPAFLINTIEEIAKIKGCSSEEIARSTSANFNNLFLRKGDHRVT